MKRMRGVCVERGRCCASRRRSVHLPWRPQKGRLSACSASTRKRIDQNLTMNKSEIKGEQESSYTVKIKRPTENITITNNMKREESASLTTKRPAQKRRTKVSEYRGVTKHITTLKNRQRISFKSKIYDNESTRKYKQVHIGCFDEVYIFAR